uniref:MI domain-containing protein n=1 Tax=Globisporangium ultimum (strain ATCC 200006 / CBS 805.95 / DAOM BR144) TaxID=431595 RepID=K3W8C0_GLOUD
MKPHHSTTSSSSSAPTPQHPRAPYSGGNTFNVNAPGFQPQQQYHHHAPHYQPQQQQYHHHHHHYQQHGGPPRGHHQHQEYRPKGAGGVPPGAAHSHETQDPSQMGPPEANGDMHPHPYKQGGNGGYPPQQHSRGYNGPVFTPAGGIPQEAMSPQGVPQQMRGPPAPQGGGSYVPNHHHQRMRGPPRGAVHGQPAFVPRGAIPQPHAQPYYPQMQMPPAAYMMGGQPVYMAPPPMQYMPMQNMNMGIPGAGVAMPMQQQRQPVAKRERKALEILDPRTRKPINYGTGKSKDETAAPVVTAPAPAAPMPIVDPKTGKQITVSKGKEPVPAETAPKKAETPAPAAAPASAASTKTAATSAAAPSSPQKKESKQNGNVNPKSPQKPAVEKAATPKKEPVSPKKKEPVVAKPTEVAKKPAVVEESKPSPASPVKAKSSAAAPAATTVTSPKVTKKEPVAQTVSPTKTAKTVSPKKMAPASRQEVVTSPITTEEAKVQPKVTQETVKEVSVVAKKTSGKTTYSVEVLLSFRERYTELPEAVTGPDSKWPTMEVVNDGPARGSSRGGRGGGGSASWEKGGQQLSRQTSRGSNGGGSQWARSQDPPPKRGGRGERGGGRGGRGGRGGQVQEPLLEGPVKPLERTENRWIPVKATSGLEAAKKRVYSIMNKMTREKFDRLAGQLTEIDMESLEMLQGVIKIIFDKALGEPHFCDMYADLCVHLEQNWKVWSFLQIVQNDDDNTFYWTTMAENDTEVVGPFDSLTETLDSARSDEFEPTPALSTLKLSEVRIQNQKFIKVWKDEQEGKPTSFYWSGQLLEDLGDDQPLNGPFESFDHANRTAIKSCSFKRILLNACQEEFEKDNIYEELEENYKKAKAEDKITTEMETDYQEKRMIMKSRMLGNIRFIGELYRKGMLQERIMHECIMKLMGVHVKDGVLTAVHPGDAPDEENLESLCKLLSTMGKDLEKKGAQGAMASYFQYLEKILLKDKRLCSRINFMIKDVIDLRNNRWEPRRKELKAKTVNEIRKEAEREQQKPPVSAPSGGGRSDSFRMDNRRSNSSRDGGFSSRSTMAPVYQSSQSMSGRSNSSNRMTLPIDRSSRNIQRDDSVSTGPQGRPASFGNASRRGGGAGGMPASFSSRSRNAPAPERSDAKPAPKEEPARGPKVEPLSEDAQEKIAKRAKSTAEEYVSIVDINEADACLAELVKEFNGHPEVGHMFAKEILQIASDAKDNVREGMFDMLEKLVLEKKSLSPASIRFGIEKLIEFAIDVWCDVPKLHEHVANLLVRFMKDSKTTGVSLDWLLCGCGNKLDADIFDEVVQGGFLAAASGHSLKLLKQVDLEKAKHEVHATYSTLQSLFAPHDRDAKAIQKWIAKYDLSDVIPLDVAFAFIEQVNGSASYDEVVGWIEKNIPQSLRTDTLFATHTSLFILDTYKKGEKLPSSERCMLLTGFCGDVETQARVVSGIFQTRTDSDEIKDLLKHLKKEAAVTPSAFSKWLELKSDTSASRKRALADFGAFVGDLARSK